MRMQTKRTVALILFELEFLTEKEQDPHQRGFGHTFGPAILAKLLRAKRGRELLPHKPGTERCHPLS